MHEEQGFNWLSIIPGLEELPNHVVMAMLVAVVLILTTLIASNHLRIVTSRPEGGIIPEPRLNYRNFFEIVAENLYKLTESVIGHYDAPVYFPIIGSLFIFILASNVIGLIPGFLPPTDNLNTTLALGAFVFIYYNYAGLKTQGLSYLKHFIGPVVWLAPLMVIIELASHIFRPLSLALRLRGNIMGDHVVLGVFSSLVPYLLPVAFYALGVFVAFIQAFVFCLMTMVYISLSTSHDH
ncbi:MAG: F0F1 ATP synthase subunit A [Candidatus Poribacteria bacterium]